MNRRDHAGVYVPPPLIFALPLGVAALLHAWIPLFVVRDRPTAAVTVAAVVALATGIWMGLASVSSFRAAGTTILPVGRPTIAVVERGPYRLTRNPMYVAMSLAYAGLALLLNNLWALTLLPLVALVIDRFVIRREERYLSTKFGEPYRQYCSRVRRWL